MKIFARMPVSIFYSDQRPRKCMPATAQSLLKRLLFRKHSVASRDPVIFGASARLWRNCSTFLRRMWLSGEKDFQQLAIIRQMVRDLNFKIDIMGVPTVRENDGLACSSRNQYLNAEERQQATVLRKALLKGAEMTRGGETSPARIVSAVRETIGQAVLARIDYVDLVDAENLQPIEIVRPNTLLALAVFFRKTPLIDNILLP